MKKCCVLVLALVAMWGLTHLAVTVQPADAAGFALFEWGNRANGMGGAVIASPDPQPSTVAYNPAAMTKLEGIQMQVGATLIAPSAKLTTAGQDSVNSKNKVYVIPHTYLTWQLTDKVWFGIGEFSRFGLGTNYDHDWFGANNIYKGSVETMSLNPNVAWQVTDELALAAGVEIIYGSLDMRRLIRPGGGIREDIHMSPEGMAVSYDLALHWTPDPKFNVGVVWRDGYSFKGRGDIDVFSSVRGDGSSTMTMQADFPGMIAFGLASKPIENLTIEFDVIHTFWSDFDRMEFFFSDKTLADSVVLNAKNTTSHKGYADSTRLQLGLEYMAWDDVYLRTGYVYDPSPQNPEFMDYMLPASNRQIVSGGLGLDFDAFSLDFSYMYLWSQDYEIDNAVAGTVKTDLSDGVTHLGGLNLTYKF